MTICPNPFTGPAAARARAAIQLSHQRRRLRYISEQSSASSAIVSNPRHLRVVSGRKAMAAAATATVAAAGGAGGAGAGEPKGRPVSGRVWKKEEASRSSMIFRRSNANLSTSWEAKRALREKAKAVKEREKELRDERKAEHERRKAEREERLRRRIANEFKTSTYQTITKTDKIKAMSKKQLRQIKKTQMNRLGEVELVSPWADPKRKAPGQAKQPWVKKAKKAKY